jgi:hypothetical protein
MFCLLCCFVSVLFACMSVWPSNNSGDKAKPKTNKIGPHRQNESFVYCVVCVSVLFACMSVKAKA